MATFQKIINHALWEIDAIGNGESAPSPLSMQAMERLFYWLDSESLNGLLQSKQVRIPYTVAASKLAYTWSASDASADVRHNLPADLNIVTFRQAGDQNSRPLKRVDEETLVRVQEETEVGTPTQVFVELGEPARMAFDAQPFAGSIITAIGGEWLIEDPSTVSLDHEVELPRGYERALILCLAKELAPSYGVALNRETMMNIKQALTKLKNRNVQPRPKIFDRGLLQFRQTRFR